MICPKCGAQMIEQKNKKNEKAPDWKCSDPSCKWKYNYQTKEWEKSDFITGTWNPKPKFNTGDVILSERVGKCEEDIEKIKKFLRDKWSVEING
jgi:ssDNA-binding Zn-finger/Zn-ribbon topoisomerase 1